MICAVKQAIQDELLFADMEILRTSDSEHITLPLLRLQNFIRELKPDTDSNERARLLDTATSSCMREMYHYARVSGLHVLECVMQTALSALRKEELQEASSVCIVTLNLPTEKVYHNFNISIWVFLLRRSSD